MYSKPLKPEDTRIRTLGPCKITSPFHAPSHMNLGKEIVYNPFWEEGKGKPVTFETSLPQKKIYFDPQKVTAGIVTCGGLCPGLNNVIRAIVLGLYHGYGVRNIYGIRYGFRGFIPDYQLPMERMTPQNVATIHEMGGTMLGSSRGQQDIESIVDTLERQNFSMLFVIGGDGSLRAASLIDDEIQKRGLKIAVAGVPKTIDNDISYVAKSFGFETAVDVATQAIQCAHTEAESYPNGVGLVKLMGRYSGFIAATAAVAQRDVNFVLIPEVDFDLHGREGFLDVLERRLEARGHALIVVAEGAGQKYFVRDDKKKDASGNLLLEDIGLLLKNEITQHFKDRGKGINLKYIDPSYIIRSVPANTNDGLFCATLGQNAVHAAMAGKTGVLVSFWNGVYCQIPFKLAVSERKQILPGDRLWLNVQEATGQPDFKAVKRKSDK